MKRLACLVLCSLSLAKGDSRYAPTSLNLTDPMLTYEQISEIVNYPIYRESTPSRLLVAPSADVLEPERTASREKLAMPVVPSAELEAPLETAEDVYEKHGSEKSQSPPSYVDTQQQPLEKRSHAQLQNNKFVPLREQQEPEMQFFSSVPPAQLSREAELPFPDFQKNRGNYIRAPSRELETPLFEPYYAQYNDQEFMNLTPTQQKPIPYREIVNEFTPIISGSLEPPKFQSSKPYHNPTKTYPKKYNSRHNDIKKKKVQKEKPVIESFNENNAEELGLIKKRRPLKLVEDPSLSNGKLDDRLESYLHQQAIEKQRQIFEETQQKKREKLENEARKQQQFLDDTVSKTFGDNQDPEASETELNTFHGGDTSFAAPISHPAVGGLADVSHGVGGERTEFRMHGQHGPHSYKFGYDTGAGKNRQFRFEERDNDGYVKGHYGFYDKHGKLQVVNYDAHPHRGFHAEGPFGKV